MGHDWLYCIFGCIPHDLNIGEIGSYNLFDSLLILLYAQLSCKISVRVCLGFCIHCNRRNSFPNDLNLWLS